MDMTATKFRIGHIVTRDGGTREVDYDVMADLVVAGTTLDSPEERAALVSELEDAVFRWNDRKATSMSARESDGSWTMFTRDADGAWAPITD